MLDIPAIMQLSGGVARWCNDIGDQVVDPEVIIGVSSRLAIDLRTAADPDAGDPLPAYPIAAFAGVASWYVAIDNDYDKATAPKLLGVTGISVATVGTKTMLYVALPSTAHAGLIAAVAAAGSVSLKADIGGLTGDADTQFIATGYTLTVRNRVWIPDGTPPTEADPPEYFSSAQVLALVAAGLDAEYSADGVSWHAEQTTGDDRFRVRFASAEGDWSPAILLPAGAKGDKGDKGGTPTIAIDAETKHWIIDGIDSGVKAEGDDAIGLPAATAEDVGKVAMVDESGAWVVQDPDVAPVGDTLKIARRQALIFG